MRLEILGQLTVWRGQERITPNGPQQRALLAVLLAANQEPVPVGRLTRVIWTDGGSPSAAALKMTVSRLRRWCERHGPICGVERIGSAYRMALNGASLDSTALLSRLAAAEDLPEGSVGRRDMTLAALARCRGPVLADLPETVRADPAVTELARAHARAVHWLTEDCLATGRPEIALPHLELVRLDRPDDERIAADLALALAASGRRAQGLAILDNLTRRLAEELGVSPGPLVGAARLRILGAAVADRTPAPPSPAPAPPAPTAADPPAPSAPPAQLPMDVHGFTGREVELDRLDALLEHTGRLPGTVLISALSGTAGVGKTALAVHWAHRNRHWFPDGQLYVNLHGYDHDRPMAAADALSRFLTALGVPGPEVAADEDELATRFRSEIADRRMLVVLDNAATVEQVRPLLPGTGSCAVLVTSRDSLSGLVALHGADRLELDLLPLGDAVALLRGLIGERADTDPDATTALATHCARLPLALRVAAELAASRDSVPLPVLVKELADQQRRLDLLDAAEDPRAAIATVFSWSVRQLPPGVARAFRLLGLHPGPDADAYAVAALAGTGLDEARRSLTLMTRAHLTHRTGPDRYGMHDLLRSYAAQLAAAEDSAEDIRAARHRLFDHYLATAAAATGRLYPAEANRRPSIPVIATPAPVLDDPDAARAWLDAERPTLTAVAAQTAAIGWPDHAVRLSAVLFRYLLDGGGHYLDALVVHGRAHAAAQATGDRVGQARALTALGGINMQMGRHDPAAEHLERAVALFRLTTDRIGEARALNVLGTLRQRLGDPAATAHHERALAVYRRAGDEIGEAQTLVNLGIGEKRLGRYDRAADRQSRALDILRRLGDRNGEAYALANLGDVETMRGGYDEAHDHHTRALALFRQLGNRVGEAWALDSLGTIYTRLGRTGPATEHHGQALAVFDEVGDRDGKPWALNGLGEAAHTAGRPAEAATHHAAALAASTETCARDQQARAHSGLGRVTQALGDRARARRHYETAAALYSDLGMPDADRVLASLVELSAPKDG
jgi:tetratricopeptide (TPR) repeat protein/DNA-binding SARP family transcriptional activator